MTTSPTIGRSFAAVVLIAIFALTACSGELADTKDQTGSGTQEPQLPTAEPGIIFADFPESATVVETLRPEPDHVTTPVGTLTIEGVEVVEAVPAAAIDVVSNEFDGEALPAEGEIFRILNLSYASDQSEVTENDEQPYAILALRSDGREIHLSHLATGQEHRILVSVPDDGKAHLVVSFDGEEQYVDVATGDHLNDGIEHPP